MNENDRADIDRLANSLTAAWNSGDGTAFAQAFTEDADFVNIYAMHIVGREGIAEQHQFIFNGVYRGSHCEFTVVKSRPLGNGAVVAHIDARLDVPQGPMEGKLRSLATAILIRDGSGWRIAWFHNTLESAPPGAPPK